MVGGNDWHLVDNAEQLTALEDACVLPRKSVEIVFSLWNLVFGTKYSFSMCFWKIFFKSMLFRSFSDIYKENIFLWRYSPLVHSHPQGLYLGRWHPLWQAPGKDQFWVFFVLSISSSDCIFEKACSLEKICFYQKVNAGSYKALGVKISETKTVDVIWEYNYRNFYPSPHTAQPLYEDFAKTRSAELCEGNIEACRCRGNYKNLELIPS